MTSSLVRFSIGLAVLTAAVACSAKDGKGEQSLGKGTTPASAGGALPEGHPSIGGGSTLPEVARVPLDSGNVLFRAKKYAEARVMYGRAAAAAPDHAAPWYGIYMVGMEMGQKALADSAMAEVRKRTPATPSTPAPADSATAPRETPFNPHAAPKRAS